MAKKSIFTEIEEEIKNPTGIKIFVLDNEKPEKLERPQCNDRDKSYSSALIDKFQKAVMSLRICEPFINTYNDVLAESIELVHPKFGALRVTVKDNGEIEVLADSKYKLETVIGKGRIIKVEHFGDPY